MFRVGLEEGRRWGVFTDCPLDRPPPPVLQREAERFAEEANREAQAGSSTASLSVPVTRVTVLPDGTYSTQTTYTSDATALAKANASKAPRPPLRGMP